MPWGPAVADQLEVVIAEDNYLVREGVRRLLEDSGRVTVLAGVGTATELLDAVRRLGPDAVLTDIRMPPTHRMEGIEAAHAIRAAHPEIGVVVLSQHVDETYALALFENGSSGLGYLLKDRVGDLDDLVHALVEVSAGGSVIDPTIVDALVRRRSRDDSDPLAALTPARGRRPARDGPRADERRHRAGAAHVVLDRREARQRDLHEALAAGDRGEPAGRRRAGLPPAAAGWGWRALVAVSTDLPRQVAPSHYAAGMLIIGIILFGMIAGAGAQLVLQRGTGINWPLAFVTGLIGSFVGGLFFSLLAGDGLKLRPSGILGSIFGAVARHAALGLDPGPSSPQGARGTAPPRLTVPTQHSPAPSRSPAAVEPCRAT